MNENDILNIIDNVSEDELSVIMDKPYTMNHIGNSTTDYNEKERIRSKLHNKIKMDASKQEVSQENIINYKDYPRLTSEDTELKLESEYKKAKVSIKNKTINNVIKSVIAAMLVFVVSVNVFPDLALALVNVPGLNKFIKVISFDKGFKNVIANGNIQEVNTSIEDNGAKFTITTIAGDDLKLWIGYELEGEDLFVGNIKFKNEADGKDLPWFGYIPDADKNYIEVHMDRLVKDFKMEVAIYTDDPSFHKPLTELDEKAISDVKQLLEKSKITTLNIPISLNDKIYKDELRVLNILGKEFKSEVGTFKIEKLELADSRSRVYCKLISNEYELVDVLIPRLIDGEGKNYSSPTDCSFYTENNTLCLELNGGIKSIEGLSFTCNGLKYVKKKDKYITIDLINSRIEPNNLGISLNNIKGSNITLNVPKNVVDFKLEAKNEKGNTVEVNGMKRDGFAKTVIFMFKELKAEKIILGVNSVQYTEPQGFDMKLID
jgi:hypothetical protein